MGYTTDTNINDICLKALKKLNAFMEGESPEAWQLNDARENLVMILDQLDNNGTKLFQKRIRSKVFVATNEVSNDDVYYRCIRSHTADADNEPGTGDNWQLYWLEIGASSISTAWTTATVYVCSADITLTEDEDEILSARIRHKGSDGEPIDIIGPDDYMDIAEKGQTGIPTCLYLESTGMYDRIARLWPIPDKTGADEYMLVYEVASKLVSPEDGTDDSPLSDNWSLYLVFKLASILGLEYPHVTPHTLSYINKRAEEYLKDARKSNSRHLKQRRMGSCYGKRYGR